MVQVSNERPSARSGPDNASRRVCNFPRQAAAVEASCETSGGDEVGRQNSGRSRRGESSHLREEVLDRLESRSIVPSYIYSNTPLKDG